jgi:hypothetical protein
VRTVRWKYVHTADGQEHLYDLSRDPQERTDVCGRAAAACAARRAQWAHHRQAMGVAAAVLGLPEPAAAAVDARTRARLRQLGYAD